MSYKFNEAPTKENDYLLRVNPCWPQYIAPDDPGYALLTTDPWYDSSKAAKEAKAKVARYMDDPDPALMKKADEEKAKDEKKPRAKRPNPVDSDSDDDEPDPKVPKTGGPRNLKRLVLNERGQLLVRDDQLNITRPLTDEERRHDLQVLPCRDRKCSQEARDMEEGGQGGVVIPGVGPPSTPSIKIAIPTFVTSVKVDKLNLRRRSPSDDILPTATVTAHL